MVASFMKPIRPLPAPHLLCAATLCLVSVAGVRGADKPTPAPAAAPAATVPAMTDPGELSPVPTPAATPSAEMLADVAAHAKTADDLWSYIKKYSGTDDLEAIDPSLDQEAKLAKAREIIHDKLAHLRPAVEEFLKKYPQDPHRWDAKLLRVFFLKDDAGISDEDADKTFHEIADAPDASSDSKRQARGMLLQEMLEKTDPSGGLTPEVDKALSDYEKDFPDDPVGSQFVALRLKMLQATPDKINGELAILAKSPNKSTADSAAKRLAIRTQPLDLKFTTTDGKEIDFTKLRGKVVLIDFWASWCVPCLLKMPEIKAINQKDEGKGFMTIGVSLDEDRAEMDKIVKTKGMDWPEYFDGKVWQSDVSSPFGIDALPAQFLVDRQGLAHPVDPDADLDAQVSKLLAVDDTKKDDPKK